MTSAPLPASALDASAPPRVRLASGAVPPGEDAPGTAVAVAREALAATATASGPGWTTERALALAVALGESGARPGAGGTTDLWEALATLAAADLGIARTVEPHLDALAILDQEREAAGGGSAAGSPGEPEAPTWGVFAAEGGGDPLTAAADADGSDAVLLSGSKPWCSLAGSLTHALITAAVADGTRGLFAVDLRHAGVEVVPGAWVARGLVEVPSGPLRMRDVPARRVGTPGWYLERPGFHWGGIQVAACWYGGAVGLARTLLRAASREGADRLLLMHLGAVDAALDGARASLAEAALLVDRGRASGEEGRLLAKRVRAVVARAVDETLTHVAHALGPAPLAQDADHAKRVADLELYVRQHHAERDDASLGGALAEGARRRAAAATDVGAAASAAPGVAFDAREPGTDADAWDADPRWDELAAPDLAGMDALLVVSAHADDESIGAAGLMATAAARGVPVTLAIVTDGAASHPGSPTRTPDELVALRRDEARAALDAVAPDARLVLLGHPDGGIRERRDAVREDLAVLLADAAPGTWVAAPWRGDGHRDHRVTGEVVAELVGALPAARGIRLAEYPVWMWHWATPDDPRVPWAAMRALPLDARVREAKRAAIRAHASQVDPLSDAPEDAAVLRPGFLRHADRDREVLIVGEDAPATPTAAERFDAAYARAEDPWRVQTRWYERRKRLATLAALPDERYGRALEIGCSIGVTTAGLAERVDELLAVDVAPTAVERARARLADSPHVRLEVRDVGADWPDGAFDLVVMSEVGYYLDDAAFDRVLAALPDALGATGTLVACHWRHPEGDFRRTGDEVHARLSAVPGLHVLARHEEDDFLLEVLSADPRSVATRTGLR
ncbi:LmbE family N-acetylglucosaminyl deacetylase/protein-L-isoaspartate O-methyltransferase [Clavibacter michiganensis]|uniref:PIG-L family deacetylase n=1 Tax=Clavibacter michiganensis TaxID=28447 RepID=UPI001AE45CA4|nr:PIG-L family deacetylase [Clavibacter michiganensis]MBP2457435.1 LmbE family N-acetylglucosaminyl deacetylase/protein-L-isoaspartate O-methyltransferase [Clavibacter michiganensis]MDQ0410005.1 LmbE family N-acetylglucosaminyl deacetylase/protein-L-isoaspartate O-methyltransferase [Clavibacter michiganensis]